jgi:hypothetical protein
MFASEEAGLNGIQLSHLVDASPSENYSLIHAGTQQKNTSPPDIAPHGDAKSPL